MCWSVCGPVGPGARGEQQQAWSSQGAFDFYRAEDWRSAGRWIEIDYAGGKPYGTFPSHHDLLGDGSVVLVDMHGHTAGSQGLLLRTPHGPVLLTGDASWVDESWRYAARPIWADDVAAWWDQIWRIKKLARIVPSLLVVAGHDLSSVPAGGRDDVIVHEAEQERTIAASEPARPDSRMPAERLPVRKLDPVPVGITDDAEVAHDRTGIERPFHQDPVVATQPGKAIDVVTGIDGIADVRHRLRRHGIGMTHAQKHHDELLLV